MQYDLLDVITLQHNRREDDKLKKGVIKKRDKKNREAMLDEILYNYVLDEMAELFYLFDKMENLEEFSPKMLEHCEIKPNKLRRRIRAGEILLRDCPDIYDFFQTRQFDGIVKGYLRQVLEDAGTDQTRQEQIIAQFTEKLENGDPEGADRYNLGNERKMRKK